MRREYKIALGISTCLFVAVFALSYYTDLKSLTVWTTNVWDSLATGKGIRRFYEYSAMNLYNLDHAMVGSDILIYLPWSIWNLPIWFIQHHFGPAIIEHDGMLLYSKLFLLMSLGYVLWMARKIAGFYSQEKQAINTMLLLAFTSFFMVTAVGYIGQNDVLVIAVF